MDLFPVVLDSDVIFSLPIRDTLLRAAEAGLYDLRWSHKILDDATRNLVNKGRMTEQQAERLQQKLKTYFAEAMVEVPSELVQVMTNHLGDRHVLATAVMAEAKVIVTFNLRHFPAESLRPWDIKAQHPDIFLTELYDTSADLLVKLIEQQSEELKKPPVTLTELLAKLS